MPIIYRDNQLLKSTGDRHPALEVNETHPCYRMVREAMDGKSVFHLNREQAYQMYKWYCDGWKHMEIVDEFGGELYSSDFQSILKNSHYLVPVKGSKSNRVPSDETIEDLWAAVEMEKKMLEAIEEEEKNED